LIIGRNGENIQEIRRTCGDGFDLQMPDRNSASDQVQLSGSPQQIQQAKTIIQQIISGGSPSVNPAQNSERIQIPKQYHSGIIGAGGSSLQTIIQQSRVQAIKFPPANEPTDEIIIIGSSSEIRAAKNLIHAKIAALEQQQAESDRLYNKQREQSNIHAQNRNRFYEAASRAYQSGDRAEAFSLSQQGKKEHHRMLKAQHQAALNIFKAKYDFLFFCFFSIFN
jgi:rRNA processing protein Krr1/Pno1